MNSELPNISPQFYGISMVPKKRWREYGYALLIIAGADGIVSDPELEWLTDKMANEVGVDKEIIKEWEKYDYESNELDDVFSRFNSSVLASFNKLLIYDAVRMSSADGEYALEEQQHVHDAAHKLKVSTETVISIEALVQLEDATNKLRLNLL